jgi:Protein of unknown function (DUF3137)
MRTNIDSLMQGGLGEWLAGQSDMRAAAKEKATSRWVWSAVVLLPVLAFLWFGPNLSGELKSFLTFGGVALAGGWGYQPIADAKKAIKIGINSAIAQSFGVSYEHDVEPGTEFGAARTYGLVPGYDRSNFEDRWFGQLEGHDFNLYETHLEEERGSGKSRRWVTVFQGVIIQMGFGRSFHSTTLLQRAGAHRKWLGLGGTKDSVNFDGHRLDQVDQVHPDFADVFSLFSDDQVEARVLVHPTYVEHLLRLESAFGAKELRALFKGGQVIIAAEGGNMFESGSMDASSDHARAQEAAGQFAAITGLALAINQNERGRTVTPDPQPSPEA